MPKPILLAKEPLGIDELEAGLAQLDLGDEGQFWEEHVEAFRETVVAAIRETSDILETEDMPRRWRLQLNRQVEVMRNYVAVADLYLSTRTGGCLRSRRERLN